MARLTTTVWIPGATKAASAATVSSPETRTAGTLLCAASAAFRPISPSERPPAAHVGDDPAVNGVGQDRAGRAGLAVVADEQRGICAVRQACHHPVGLGLAAKQLGTPVELLGNKVPETVAAE